MEVCGFGGHMNLPFETVLHVLHVYKRMYVSGVPMRNVREESKYLVGE